MRKITLPIAGFLILMWSAGCSREPKVKTGSPDNPDSPIIVSDTSSSVAVKLRSETAAKVPSGVIKHFSFLLSGSQIDINDTSSDSKKYKITQVTFSSYNNMDSAGNPFTPVVIQLKNVQWTILINNAYKLFSGDDQDVSIAMNGHPFDLSYDGTNWNMVNTEGQFSSVVLSDFSGNVLYPALGQAQPGPGNWVITFDYCKNGQCS